MLIKVISFYPERVKKHQANWKQYGELEVIKTTEDLVTSHHEVSWRARKEQWDETVIVMQDDVVIDKAFPEHVGRVTAYARKSDSHVCPLIFTATPAGWHKIEFLFRTRLGTDGICPRFRPDHVYADVAHHEE